MSFIAVPSRICIPAVPNLTYDRERIFCGNGADAGMYAFSCTLGHIISNRFAYYIDFNNSRLSPVFRNVNDFIYWEGSGFYLYKSINFDWVIISGKFPGYEPEEYYDPDTGKYNGDAFWSGNIPNPDNTSLFSPRGLNRNEGTSKSAEAVWERWQSTSVLGEHTPQGGATGKRYFGSPRWIDDKGVYYVRSVSKNDGKYSYGSIVYNNSKWIIGAVGDSTGWWEGSEPSKNTSVIFQFKKPVGSEIVGQNKTITFRDYVIGDEMTEIYLSEVAVWR